MRQKRIDAQSEEGERLMQTLERLLAIQSVDLESALDEASDLLVEALRADKIDVFLYKPESSTLVAMGVSETAMSARQIALGLNMLPVANGGREVDVFRSGESYMSGYLDLDTGALPGFRFELGARSMLIVPLDVEAERKGVIQAAAERTEAFSHQDLFFLQAVARWVGIVARKAQLIERITCDAAEQARQMAAYELVTILAHDLNNHLTSVKGRVDRLHRRAEKENREQDLADAQSLSLSVDRLTSLVDDLLDTERIEHGMLSLDRQSVELVPLARETVAALNTQNVPVQIGCRIEEEPVLNGDPARLRQALENLLSNAIKHSPAGVQVKVEIATENREDGIWAVVTVKDGGPGVDPEIVPRLFSRFGNGSDSSGLGLGLYMARGIAEAHGGSLVHDPSFTGGASFRMALPLNGTGSSEDPPEGPGSHASY